MGLSHVLRNPLERVGILGWLDQINGFWKTLVNVKHFYQKWLKNILEKQKHRHFAYSSGRAKMC